MGNKILPLKNFGLAAAIVLILSAYVLPVSVNADVVDILNLGPDGTINSDFDVSGGALVGDTVTYTLTRTGDLDSGTLDDTLRFDLIYRAYTGSTFLAGDVTLGTASTPNINNVNWHSNEFTTGDTLSLEVANVSYIDGEGDETVVFNGFTSIRPTATTNINSPAGDIDYYVGLAGATTVTVDPTAEVNLASNGTSPTLFVTAASGPVRLRLLDLQFETVAAVPEPTSLAMLFGGLGLLAMRRRRV